MGFSGTVNFGSTANDPWLSVDISSVAFSIGELHIRWYGILIGLGMLLAILYVSKYARSFGVDSDRLLDVALVSIVVGVLGARLYYVVFNLDEFIGEPWTEIFNIPDGGLAIYGGIIFGVLAGWLLCKWRKVNILPALDLAACGFLIGQCIGRWGNFTNQEAFGINTNLPWGMYSTRTNYYLVMMRSVLDNLGMDVDPTKPVHPCFLYESLWCLLGLILLHFVVRKRRQYDGQMFLLYVLWYGLGRFWIESLRTDSLMFGPYRASQMVAVICVVTALILLRVFRKRRSIFGEEGLKLQLAAEAEAKELKLAAKAEDKAAKAAAKAGVKAPEAAEAGKDPDQEA